MAWWYYKNKQVITKCPYQHFLLKYLWLKLVALRFFSNKYITDNVEGINETRLAKRTHYLCIYLTMSLLNFKTLRAFIILFKVPIPLSKMSWGILSMERSRSTKDQVL